VVVVVVVVAGEAAAWAETITVLTNRLDPAFRQNQRAQRSLQNASTIDGHRRPPTWARSMRRPQNIRKISDCAVPLKPSDPLASKPVGGFLPAWLRPVFGGCAVATASGGLSAPLTQINATHAQLRMI
jgi:hypothetical protein